MICYLSHFYCCERNVQEPLKFGKIRVKIELFKICGERNKNLNEKDTIYYLIPNNFLLFS